MSKSGVTYVNPPSAGPAQGMYSHVARMTPGEIAFIAGQVAIDAKGTPIGVGDVAAQVPVVFDNLGKILKDLGADFEVGRAAHDLSHQRRLHPGLHVRACRSVPQDVPGRQISAQHAADRKPPGEARVPARGGSHRAFARLTSRRPAEAKPPSRAASRGLRRTACQKGPFALRNPRATIISAVANRA